MTERTETLATLTLAQLLGAYAALGPDRDAERGRRAFAERFAALRRHFGAKDFANILIAALDKTTSAAAAHLVLARQWVDATYVDAFHARRQDDDPRWDWAIHRLLRTAATPNPFGGLAKPVAAIRAPNGGGPQSIRRYRSALPAWQAVRLEWAEREAKDRAIAPSAAAKLPASLTSSSLYDSLTTLEGAMALLLALGCTGDFEAWTRLDEYQDYVDLISAPDGQREAILQADPWRFYPLFGIEDTINSIAVHLDTVGPSYRRNPKPSLDPRSIFIIDGIAIRVAGAITGKLLHAQSGLINGKVREDRPITGVLSADFAILTTKPEDLDIAERARLQVMQWLLDRTEENKTGLETDTSTPGAINWEMGRIRCNLLDPCFRGAAECREWLGAQAADADPLDWLVAHRAFGEAWTAAGYVGSDFKSMPDAGHTPYARTAIGERWAHAFAALGDDPRYDFAVKLDTAWQPCAMEDIQSMMRAVISAQARRDREGEWPDLLELGTGALSLPPVEFYEATLALGNVARRVLGEDLAEGWVSVALGPLVGVDPLAQRYFSEYAPNEPLTPGQIKWQSAVAPALIQWRKTLDAASQLPERHTSAIINKIWTEAWEGCNDVRDRLLLARDAVAMGILSAEPVGLALSSLFAQATPDNAVEFALLAGYLAKSQSDPSFLQSGLDCLAKAEPGPWVAEALHALAPLVDKFDQHIDPSVLQHVLGRLSARDRSVAQGQSARWLRDWLGARWPEDQSLRLSLAATTIVAMTTEEVESSRDRTLDDQSIEVAWTDLVRLLATQAEAGSLVAAIDTIVDIGASRGLVLTTAATDAFDAIAASYLMTETAAERLLPLVDAIPRTSVPWVRARRVAAAGSSRLSSSFAQALGDHAALWLFEIERAFTAEDVDTLCRLIDVGDDRSAARARLVLHGAHTWIGNNPHQHSLSAHPNSAGRETVERLATLDASGHGRGRSGRGPVKCLYEWRNDDPAVIRQWLDRLSANAEDATVRRALFRPWRWSQECAALCIDWSESVTSVSLANEIAVWIGVVQLAVSEGLEAATLPRFPVWREGSVPDLEWLPRVEADRLVIEVIAGASVASGGGDAYSLSISAEQSMRAHARSLRHGEEITSEDYLSLGLAVTQKMADVPESALNTISIDNWTEAEVIALGLWAKRCLDRWYAGRQDLDRFDLFNEILCTSLLSILTCLFDTWPNTIRAVLHQRTYTHAELGKSVEGAPTSSKTLAWDELLVEVILHFPNNRIAQAAWTLLAGAVGPETNAALVWKAFLSSMRDEPVVRDRALLTLLTIEGRTLAAVFAPKITLALDEWEGVTKGQTTRALAEFFAILAREPMIDVSMRRRIIARLRAIANRPSSRRPLFQLIGTGGKNDGGYRVVGEGRLDFRLREIERALLIDLTQ
jgi:hypothetical protein